MKRILYFIIGAILLTSCNEYLDVKPVGKMIPSSIEDFEKLLNNSATYDWIFMDGNKKCILSTLSDNYEYSDNYFAAINKVTSSSVDKAMAYKYNRPYTDPKKPDYIWNSVFKSAYYYNNVISGVEEFKNQDEDLANEVLAQAIVGRAFLYLNASLVYGPAYKPAGNNNVKSIPFRTQAEPLDKNPDLSTTQEVFERVEREFLDAMDNIPEYSNNVRFNKISLQTALAYFYMLKGDFPKMLSYADDAWKDAIAAKGEAKNLLYDYNKMHYVDNGLSPVPGTDPETKFTLNYDNGSDPSFDQTISKEIILYRRAPNMSYEYASQEFIGLFSNSDLRKKLFMLWYKGYKKGSINDGIVKKYYRASKLGYGMTTGFSYPELLLMRAEAYARTGESTLALADLNLLRKYRYETGTEDLKNLSGDELLNEILNERRRELPSPSHKRFIDLKRYAAYDIGKPWAKETIVHHLMKYTAVPTTETPLAPVETGTSFSTKVDSKSFILPISNEVLRLNPEWGIELAPEDYNPS